MTARSWGDADERGAGNELTAAAVLRGLAGRNVGRVVDLSQPLSRRAPRDDEQSPYALCLWSHPQASRREHAEAGATNGIGFAVERVELDLHTGTHVDALGHCVIGEQMYNGVSVDDAVTNHGLAKLGIENAPPMVTRGVLVDVPTALGRELESGELITLELLQRTLDRQRSTLAPGDIVLIRAGWARHYGVDNETYLEAWPGIGIDAARWLAERRVAAVGADTFAFEVWPPEDPGVQWPVHQELLVRSGVYIIEQAQLDELAELCAYEFLCLCLPIRFVGGTGSPVRLTAVL